MSMCGANVTTMLVMTWLALAFTCWSIVGARNRILSQYFGPHRMRKPKPWIDIVSWAVFFAFTGFMLGVYAQAIWRII